MISWRASAGISFLSGAGEAAGVTVVFVVGTGEADLSDSGCDWQAEEAIRAIAVIQATARRRAIRGGIVTLPR
jgi:hypothetical protein